MATRRGASRRVGSGRRGVNAGEEAGAPKLPSCPTVQSDVAGPQEILKHCAPTFPAPARRAPGRAPCAGPRTPPWLTTPGEETVTRMWAATPPSARACLCAASRARASRRRARCVARLHAVSRSRSHRARSRRDSCVPTQSTVRTRCHGLAGRRRAERRAASATPTCAWVRRPEPCDGGGAHSLGVAQPHGRSFCLGLRRASRAGYSRGHPAAVRSGAAAGFGADAGARVRGLTASAWNRLVEWLAAHSHRLPHLWCFGS